MSAFCPSQDPCTGFSHIFRHASHSALFAHTPGVLLLVALLGQAIAPSASARSPAPDGQSRAAYASQAQASIPLALTLLNRSRKVITCEATLAHWFQASLVQIDPAGHARVALDFDPDSGTISIIAASGERQAVETVWCGYREAPWRSRSQLRLDRSRFERDAHRHVVCRDGGQRLMCRTGGE